ncbi:MAG TPA: PPC domain-containing protein [Pirellulales bacterium]|nr:PPC domain-containing protein [Pirellulales bacterium]
MKQLLTAALVVAAITAGDALAQPPSVGYLVPAAALPGQATDLALFGGNLASPTAVWSNMPAAKVELAPGIDGNGTKADQLVYRVTLPAETPVGIYGLRLATGKGASNLRLVMVDDLASVSDNGNNKTIPTAQSLNVPTAVDGACEAESYDFYKLTAAAGQRISVEVVARRLGSALDPVIRLLDAAGRELAYSDDEPGIGADCRFVHQFASPGDYYLEVRDIRYQGSPNHRYRLRIGNFPLVNTPFPLGAPKGSTPKLVAAGPVADAVAPMNVTVPSELAGGQLPMAVKFPQGQGSSPLTLIASTGPEQVEFEPNDTPETATAIAAAWAISGRLQTAKDRDFYEFSAKKGERLVFAGRTRSIGSPSDLFLRIYNAAGGLLVEAEDAGTEEGAINFTFPEDGVYRLMVEDLLHRGGPEYCYRIEIQPYQAGFALAVEAEKYDVPRSGVFAAKVTSARRDYNGPITLSVAGAGDGFVLVNNVIPEGKNETVLSVTVPARLEPGQLHTMQIVGQAKIGDADVRATASTLAALRKEWNGLPYPPAALDGLVGLGVGPVFADFFQLAVEPSPVPFAQIAGAASFNVKATKSNGFDDVISLAVDGLPPGVTAAVTPIAKGQPQAAVQLTGPGSLAEGDYRFRIVGSSTFQNQPKQVIIDNAVLRVVRPLEVTVAPAGPVKRGANQKVKLTVARTAAAAGAITLRLKNLPTGMNAPAEITLAEGQNEIEVDVTAAAEAPLGEVGISAVATTKVKEKQVTIESPVVALAVVQ